MYSGAPLPAAYPGSAGSVIPAGSYRSRWTRVLLACLHVPIKLIESAMSTMYVCTCKINDFRQSLQHALGMAAGLSCRAD